MKFFSLEMDDMSAGVRIAPKPTTVKQGDTTTTFYPSGTVTVTDQNGNPLAW